MGIGGVGFPKLGAHPLLLLAELEPEHDEENDESHKSAHLGERDRRAKEPSQHAGVDGVTDHCVGPGGDQFVVLLNRDGLAPVATQVLSRPDGEQKAGDHDGSSQPEGPKPGRQELKIEPAQRDASCREQDDRDQEGERAQDARGYGLKALGGFCIAGFDLPVDEKGDPENGKERFVEPEHEEPPGTREKWFKSELSSFILKLRQFMLSRLPLDRFDSAGKVGDLGGKEVILSRLGVAFSNRLRSHSGASVTVVDLLLWLFFQQSTGDYTDNLVVYEMALF